jgi:catecholate siderophore receptor
MSVRYVSLVAISFALAAPAFAAEAVLDEAAAADDFADPAGESIVVTGQRPEYGAQETCTATRTCTDVKDVPQSISVISESQIEDQAMRSIGDVLRYVPLSRIRSARRQRGRLQADRGPGPAVRRVRRPSAERGL